MLGRVYIRTFENNSELSHIADECVILLLAIIEFATNNVNLSTDEINKSMSTLKLSHVEFFRVVSKPLFFVNFSLYINEDVKKTSVRSKLI